MTCVCAEFPLDDNVGELESSLRRRSFAFVKRSMNVGEGSVLI